MTTWRWMAGMRYIRPQYSHHHRVSDYEIEHEHVFDEDCEPDWSDPATMGCLVHQVREAFPGGWVSTFEVKIDGEKLFACWHYRHDGRHLTSYGETEAEALINALRGYGVG